MIGHDWLHHLSWVLHAYVYLASNLTQLQKLSFMNNKLSCQHELVSWNHLLTFTFAIVVWHNKVYIAEEIIIKHKLGSFFGGWSRCLPISINERHGSLVTNAENLDPLSDHKDSNKICFQDKNYNKRQRRCSKNLHLKTGTVLIWSEG